jgi:NPCBM/NEW2 domain
MIRLAACLLTALFAATSPAADLSTLTGKKYKGELKRIDAALLTFDADIGMVAVPLKDLFVLDFGRKPLAPADGAKFDELELTDGSVFRCTGIKIKGKTVEVPLLPVKDVAPPVVSVPLTSVFAYVRGADSQKTRDEWKKLLAVRGKRDLYVFRQADGLNAQPGTVIEGGDDGDSLTFEDENGQRLGLRLSRAIGLVFNQPPRDVIPPTVCKLFDVFGNTLFATKLDLAASGLTVTTVNGATVVYPSTAGLVKLDFSQGNIAYLSDLDCAVSAPKAEPDQPVVPLLKDTAGGGLPLKLDGTAYAKGLWVAPETTLTYKIGSEFREFKAVVGISESTEVASSGAKLVIAADGRELFSGPITRKAKPKELVLDVKGVKELTIRVDPDGLFTGNQVILAEARLQK